MPMPHPPVIGTDQRVDRAQPVMPGRAAAALDPAACPARRSISSWITDDLVRARSCRSARPRRTDFARVVHEGLRLQQVDAARRRSCPSASSPLKLGRGTAAKPWRARDRVRRHEADIVAVRARSGCPGLPSPTMRRMDGAGSRGPARRPAGLPPPRGAAPPAPLREPRPALHLAPLRAAEPRCRAGLSGAPGQPALGDPGRSRGSCSRAQLRQPPARRARRWAMRPRRW